MTETNRYAHQETEKKSPLPQFSRLRNWKDVSLHELKVFFGLIVAMGMTRKTSIDEYWSTDETNSTPLFSKMMAKDRFLLILANLHLVDNEQVADQHDPLFKVRPILCHSYRINLVMCINLNRISASMKLLARLRGV